MTHHRLGIISHVSSSDANQTSSSRPVMLRLDLGREKNTWMDGRWARSGIRLSLSILVEFLPDENDKKEGKVVPLKSSPYIDLGLEGGRWRLEGDTLAFDLTLKNRLKRLDLTFDPNTRIFFAINAWKRRSEITEEALIEENDTPGSSPIAELSGVRQPIAGLSVVRQQWILSSRRGTLCIEQRRWLVRKERRLVGGFTAKTIDSRLDLTQLDIEPLKVTRGTFDGPRYN